MRLNRVQQRLLDILKAEGAEVVDVRRGGRHIHVDYTFDHKHFFTQYLPYGNNPPPARWEKNFRAAIRRNRP